MSEATPFPTSSPEAQGISSNAILAFVDAVNRDIHDLNSFILLRRGTVVAESYWEPYGPAQPHMLFSLSKSFTSSAIGMLVADGRLSVDDYVLDYFSDEAPAEPSANLRAMRVRHLLTMTTGHDIEPLRGLRQVEMAWTRAFLTAPVEHQPGTHFLYNSLATYMLSAIAQRITGQRVVDFLGPRLFGPLGIENPTWETSPEGINTGGWGLSIKTRDIARFGQLYLQRGVWQGKRLITDAWVAEATARQVPNGPSPNPDWEQGYGYQFWRCRHGAYRGDGAFGQFCVVMPEQEAVLAVTSGVGNMQVVLDLVWKHLLPAMGSDRLPDDSAARQTLAGRLAGLRVAPIAGKSASPLAAALSGREFALAENSEQIRAIAFDFTEDGCTLTFRDDQVVQQIPCGHGRWARGETTLPRARRLATLAEGPAQVAASGGWVDDRTYAVKLCWYQTPFQRTLTCRFEDDRVQIDQKANVGFEPMDLPRLEGRAAPVPSSGRR